MRAVDADDVSRVLLNLRDRNIENKDMVFALEWAAQSVSRLPTLSPDDVRVKATLFGGDADGYADGFPVYSTFVCSACGEEFGVDDGQPPPFSYCPECGAKLEIPEGE